MTVDMIKGLMGEIDPDVSDEVRPRSVQARIWPR
jgi:hypothetical protein